MTPVATLVRDSTAPSTGVPADSQTESEREALLALHEPQMLAMLDDAICRQQEHRRNPDIPTQKEWKLANAKARSLTPILRLKSLLELCGEHRLGELGLSPELLASLRSSFCFLPG